MVWDVVADDDALLTGGAYIFLHLVSDGLAAGADEVLGILIGAAT